VDRIETGLIAVEDLLSAILDISRLDTAAPQPRYEDFPVTDLFTALHAQFGQTFLDKGLKLKFSKTSLRVRSDPALLRRILQNFVSNAHRYTRSGGVLVGCRRRKDNSVAIQVVDTGSGIADADRTAVFEEFRRLANSNSQSKRGLGLGLAIVDRIARLLGHTINLRSSPGRGSCFEVVVPRAFDAGQAQNVEVPVERRSSASLADQHILCIDNENEILVGMRGLLSKWGAEPLTASNLKEALVEIMQLQGQRGQVPALLLVDFHLDNGVTGIDVISSLRDETGTTFPAVILTADHTDDVIEQARTAGHALLHKPIKPAALRALINRILARRDVG
jgi:CheY-like chemotaxis protein